MPPQRLQHCGEAVGLLRRQEPVDMIGHQPRGVHSGGLPRHGLLRTRPVEAIIVRMHEERLTIRPAWDDMRRDVREGVAGWPGHRQPHDGGRCRA